MSADKCPVCLRRVGPRANAVNCFCCQRRIHVICDNTITPRDQDFWKSHQPSSLKYICPNCILSINHIDASASTCSMRETNPPLTPNRPSARHTESDPSNQPRSTHPSQVLEARLNVLENHLLSMGSKLDQLTKNHETRLVKSPPQPSDPKSTHPVTSTPSRVREPQHKAKTSTVSQIKNAPRKPVTHSVIVTNVAESSDPVLQSLHNHNLTMWEIICTIIGLPGVKPVSITRLTRHHSSPHSNMPRLLRVDLPSASILEDVLLSAHLLRESDLPARIYPDIPWTERATRRLHRQQNVEPRISGNCSIIVHGIPEINDTNVTDLQRKRHDRDQWHYLSQLLSITEVVATDVRRLPRPPTYKGSAHRLLLVSFLTEEMATQTLSLWYTSKRLAPPDVRFRPLRAPKNQEHPKAAVVPSQENPFSLLLNQSDSRPPTIPISITSAGNPPKNGSRPASPRPV